MTTSWPVDQGVPAAPPNLWPLEPGLVFLNHGSFGSCPLKVLEFQREIRDRFERDPIQFLGRDLESFLDIARLDLARFVGAASEDLVFVQNATAGVNTVLRSLSFESGDELLVTDQEYNACKNALEFVAERARARVVVCPVPFPLRSPGEALDAVLGRVTARTRLALIDHVTSQTGMVLPVGEIVARLQDRGVDCLVDGAHAPGMVPLDLTKLGAAYYTGNCHKWMCAPKTAAFLCVRKDRQPGIRPLIISHGANSPRRDRSRFLIEFAWTGTSDPSPALSVPEAIRYMQELLPGGWDRIRARNRELALAGRRLLCRALGVDAPCPDEMIGSLASVPLPDSIEAAKPPGPLFLDPWQTRLRLEKRIEVPVVYWPGFPRRLIRVSAQLYNSLPEYELLATTLKTY